MPDPTNPSSPSPTTSSPSPAPASAAGTALQSGTVEPSLAPEPDWSSLLTDADTEADPVPETPASPTPEPVAQATPEPAPPTPEEPVQPPQPEAAQPPAQAEGPTPEWRQGMVRQLTPTYAFAQETIDAYNEDPTQVLPQLAATVHTRIIEDVARMIDAANAQLLPKILDGHFQRRDAASELRQREFEMVHTPYPRLKEADPDVVKSMAKAIAKAHPKSAPGDRIRMLAERVYASEGWDMPWKAAAPAAPRPNGYTPAAPAALGAGGAPRPADNPFSSPDLLNE